MSTSYQIVISLIYLTFFKENRMKKVLFPNVIGKTYSDNDWTIVRYYESNGIALMIFDDL